MADPQWPIGLRRRCDEEGHGAAGGVEFEARGMHTLHKPTYGCATVATGVLKAENLII